MEQNDYYSNDSELTKHLQATIGELNLELSSMKDRNQMLELARLDYEELMDSFNLQIRLKRQSIKRKFGIGDNDEVETKKMKLEEEYVEEAEVKVEDEETISAFSKKHYFFYSPQWIFNYSISPKIKVAPIVLTRKQSSSGRTRQSLWSGGYATRSDKYFGSYGQKTDLFLLN